MSEDRIGKIIDLAAARTEKNAMSFLATLDRNKDGAILGTISNAMRALRHDPALQDTLAFNEFTSAHLLMQPAPGLEDGDAGLPGPYPRPWGAEDVALIQGYLQRLYSPKFNRQTVEEAMLAAAATRRFHPVRDWLATLTWDGTPRIDTWLSQAFGTPADEYHAAVGAKFLIAAVRRVRSPGCKFDTMPVLEGNQGLGKSRACKALFSADWFSDTLPSDLAGKEAAMSLLGVWGLELAEIEHLVRSEPETIKAFLSRGTDRYRPPYGKSFVDRPRQGVLVGTTNSFDYLRDATGNRRIWPIRCTHADPDWVAENRVQLWAEAAAREASGEVLWLDDEAVQKVAKEAQAARMTEDVWADKVREFIDGKGKIRMPELLSDALFIPTDRQDRRSQMRVAAILRSEGWTVKIFRPERGSDPARMWCAPGFDPYAQAVTGIPPVTSEGG